MKNFNPLCLFALVLLSVSLATGSVSYAEATADQSSHFTHEELEQMLAPIALYPDALLSQLLMAATYPLEVVEAARWSSAHPDLSGDESVKQVADKNWDPSVKSMVAFPRILTEMNEKLDWTERLGDAFLGQQEQVTDVVQELRQKAYDAGNLRSSDQIHVDQQGQTIVVAATNPDVTYVPYYNPTVVYGPWWGMAPPVYWDPWPGYYYRPGYSEGFAWGVGITVATGFFFGSFDWGHHHANVEHVNNYYFNSDHYYNHVHDHDYHGHDEHDHGEDHHEGPQAWQHDPSHRRGVPYHDTQLRQQYGRSSAAADEHSNYRGRDLPVMTNHRDDHESSSHDQGNHNQGTHDQTNHDQRSHESNASSSGQQGDHNQESHNTVSPYHNERSSHELRAHAFEDMNRGSAVRDDSNRGRNSHQQMISQTRSAPVVKAQPNRPKHVQEHQRQN